MATFQTLARRTRRALRRLTDRTEDARVREIAATLQSASLLCDLPHAVLMDLAEVAHVRTYPRDEVLYYEGDPGLGLYVVRRGRVRLLTEGSDATPYEQRVVEEGGYFGDLSVTGGLNRRETAQALTDAEVVGLFTPGLRALVRRAPATGVALYESFARHLAERQNELLRLVEALAPAAPSDPFATRAAASFDARALYDQACLTVDTARARAAEPLPRL